MTLTLPSPGSSPGPRGPDAGSLPTVPAIVRGRVVHERRSPIRHRLGATTYLWLVDVDRLPAPTPLGAIRTEDHFAGTSGTLRAAVDRFVTAAGERLDADDRVLLLTNARALGHVFNPLSVYWCIAPSGALRWLLLEIHNTYGERHAQLLHPDAQGRAEVDKEFYVSPFFSVSGRYLVRHRLDRDRVAISITLRQDDRPVFAASFTGRPKPLSRKTVRRAALLTPLVTHQVSARIRAHGIWLWMRRLPVVQRSTHTPPEGLR